MTRLVEVAGYQSGGVTAPSGFRAAGVAAGLKASGAPDLALVVNDGPRFDAAAVFTSNRVKAAPVLWTQQCAREGRFRAVVLNSGGANACTGPGGLTLSVPTRLKIAAREWADGAEAREQHRRATTCGNRSTRPNTSGATATTAS